MLDFIQVIKDLVEIVFTVISTIALVKTLKKDDKEK